MNDAALDVLLRGAEQALAEDSDPAARLARIEIFVADFGQWYEQHEKQLQAGMNKGEVEQVRLLLEKHRQIMDYVEALLQGTSAEMRRVRTRARAILAYAGGSAGKRSGGRERRGKV